jgi:hypothetical protein
MTKTQSIQAKANNAIRKAVHNVIKRRLVERKPFTIVEEGKPITCTPQAMERINKNGREFIISQYGPQRYFVVVIDKKGNLSPPHFPFDTLDRARRWVETTDH